MKKFTKDSNYKEMTTVAKSLGLKFVGITKEALANSINEKLNEKSSQPKIKWYEIEGNNPFNTGDLTQIQETYSYKGIHGRTLQITKPSSKEGKVKGFLLHPITNEPQKCEIIVNISDLKLI